MNVYINSRWPRTCNGWATVSRNRSVLIVDDDEAVRKLMSIMIAQEGYKIFVAPNGYEALRLAEVNPVDLLISDVEMPGMTGPELVLALTWRGLIERSLLVSGNLSRINPVDGITLCLSSQNHSTLDNCWIRSIHYYPIETAGAQSVRLARSPPWGDDKGKEV